MADEDEEHHVSKPPRPTSVNTNARKEVQRLLTLHVPTRVIVLVRRKAQLSGQPPSAIFEDVLSTLGLSDTRVLFLVHERWERLDIFVFDLFHTSYNVEFGHWSSSLPVIVVDYGHTKQRTSIAYSIMREQVNDGVAQHRNLNGWHGRPPYMADHTLPEPPSYDCPRDTRLLQTPQAQ